MTTMTAALLDFILGLLRNDDAVQEFRADPDAALASAGLSEVRCEDVDAVLPVVIDHSPVGNDVSFDSSFDRDFSTGNRGDVEVGGVSVTAPTPGRDDDDHSRAVQQIDNIVTNYSVTTTIDDRDTIVDQSVNQNIWAGGDVTQLFDNDAVIASGDGAVAAGGDIDNVVTGDHNVIGDGNVVGDDNAVGNTETNVDVSGDGNAVSVGGDATTDNSTNTDIDVDIDDSFNDSSTDNSTDIDVDIDDSFNDNSTNTDVDIDDSFNDNSDNSTNTDVDIDDSFNDNSTNVDVDDSFNDNSTTDNSVTDNSDNSTDVDVDIEDSFTVDDSFNEANDNVTVEDSFDESGPGDLDVDG